jgi:hypothetical protein
MPDKRWFVHDGACEEIRLRRSEFWRDRRAERVPSDVSRCEMVRGDERRKIRDILFNAALRRRSLRLCPRRSYLNRRTSERVPAQRIASCDDHPMIRAPERAADHLRPAVPKRAARH